MNSGRLKVCVVTGARSEYGLLEPLMHLIRRDKEMKLQLLVTGMHLSPEFGLTYKQIEDDGYKIDEDVEILLSADTPTAVSKATGLGLIGFADALQRLEPDWMVVLGDRFETFAAVVAAHFMGIPISHIHGGELTEGAIDDAMRHAITKMAYFHFTATNEYRKRVIQLGEQPTRVFNTGAIGLDSIQRVKFLSKRALEQELQFSFGGKTVLVTYHPVTLERQPVARQVSALLTALEEVKDLSILFTLPNADAGGREIISMINNFVATNPGRSKAFASLGTVKYYSTLRFVQAVIGNSSSGIIEVPYFKVPTVNIGDRQRGRIRSGSVIDSRTDAKAISSAVKKALSASFVARCKKVKNPYGDGGAAAKIVSTLKTAGRITSLKKAFYDLPR